MNCHIFGEFQIFLTDFVLETFLVVVKIIGDFVIFAELFSVASESGENSITQDTKGQNQTHNEPRSQQKEYNCSQNRGQQKQEQRSRFPSELFKKLGLSGTVIASILSSSRLSSGRSARFASSSRSFLRRFFSSLFVFISALRGRTGSPFSVIKLSGSPHAGQTL